eukprot:jgi/Mesvir1/27694/Mv07409-RA.1
MPGPGSHLLYGMGTGYGLMFASDERFSAWHVIVFAANGYLGPDIGSFFEWLLQGVAPRLGTILMHYVHDPWGYTLLLGLPMALIWRLLTRLLATPTQPALSFQQTLALVPAGALSHFFIDNLFEENGQTAVMKRVLATGWWEKGGAPLDPGSVVVAAVLTILLVVGFISIHRRPSQHLPLGGIFQAVTSVQSRTRKSLILFGSVAALYTSWCLFLTYGVTPRRPAMGEEPDLGVIPFLALFFFLPSILCHVSMHPRLAAMHTQPFHFV